MATRRGKLPPRLHPDDLAELKREVAFDMMKQLQRTTLDEVRNIVARMMADDADRMTAQALDRAMQKHYDVYNWQEIVVSRAIERIVPALTAKILRD